MLQFIRGRINAGVEALLLSGLIVLGLMVVPLGQVLQLPMTRAATSSVLGIAFQDLDRDGSRDFHESPLAGHRLYLFDATGTYVAAATTAADGSYRFDGLNDGTHTVQYAASSWWGLRDAWVPTTTGGLRPRVSVEVRGSARVDFGWRPLTTSTDVASPIAEYVGPSGLRIATYNDAVDPVIIHDAVIAGWTGDEASMVTIRFGLAPNSTTTTTVSSAGGRYVSFGAVCYVSYISWLDTEDRSLSHEYGHAWSLYHAYLVQQDASLAGYLAARGLADDPRIGSNYAWSPRELIAEDFRVLFGSNGARAGGQLNTEIPLAGDVPGLREYLSGPFIGAVPTAEPTPSPSSAPSTPTQVPSPSPSVLPATPVPTPTPTAIPVSPSPYTEIAITALTISPQPVRTRAEASFRLSAAANISVDVLDTRGAVVRRLVVSQATGPGIVDVSWNRKDDAGRRVKSGTYVLRVQADTSSGLHDQESASFTAS